MKKILLALILGWGLMVSTPSTWGAEPGDAAIFVPPGLNPGDEYHIAFVTRGTRDALSVDIADYNQFVRDEAVSPGALTEEFGIAWFAIGSTPEVDAKDNAVISAPVYLLDGTRLSPLVPVLNHWYPVLPFNRDQFGTLYEGFVWTGSMDGVADVDFPLGSPYSGETVLGLASSPVNWDFADAMVSSIEYPLYALSEVLTVPVPDPVILVEIDIKPGNDLNLINPRSKGVIPVAIFSTEEFDATLIDPRTVSLAGAEVAVRGQGKTLAYLEDVNRDGLLDLVCKVETESLNEDIDAGEVRLTGETFFGEKIKGSDLILIVPNLD